MANNSDEPTRVGTTREAAAKTTEPERRPLMERIAELAADYRRHPLSGLQADKAFFDKLSGNS